MIAQATQTQTNGAHDTVTPQIDLQSWRDAVDAVTQRARDYYGPELEGRIHQARGLVLDGLVQPDQERARIASGIDLDTEYDVTRESCTCLDYSAHGYLSL